MFRSLLMLLAALSLGGCIESEAPLVEERRLLLSGEDFSAYDAPDGGRYEKLVTYAARSIDLSFETVSYTHLDVYKRQDHECVGGALAATLGAIGRQLYRSVHRWCSWPCHRAAR